MKWGVLNLFLLSRCDGHKTNTIAAFVWVLGVGCIYHYYYYLLLSVVKGSKYLCMYLLYCLYCRQERGVLSSLELFLRRTLMYVGVHSYLEYVRPQASDKCDKLAGDFQFSTVIGACDGLMPS